MKSAFPAHVRISRCLAELGNGLETLAVVTEKLHASVVESQIECAYILVHRLILTLRVLTFPLMYIQVERFTVMIKTLLDHLESFSLSQARKLFSMLGAIAAASSAGREESTLDDIHIIITKQLSSSKSRVIT